MFIENLTVADPNGFVRCCWRFLEFPWSLEVSASFHIERFRQILYTSHNWVKRWLTHVYSNNLQKVKMSQCLWSFAYLTHNTYLDNSVADDCYHRHTRPATCNSINLQFLPSWYWFSLRFAKFFHSLLPNLRNVGSDRLFLCHLNREFHPVLICQTVRNHIFVQPSAEEYICRFCSKTHLMKMIGEFSQKMSHFDCLDFTKWNFHNK